MDEQNQQNIIAEIPIEKVVGPTAEVPVAPSDEPVTSAEVPSQPETEVPQSPEEVPAI